MYPPKNNNEFLNIYTTTIMYKDKFKNLCEMKYGSFTNKKTVNIKKFSISH